MIKLDENLLLELGLGSLPKPEKTAFLKHMYETLEMRVGTRLAERMSDQQMAEFEQYINGNDEQGAFHWLENNFPNYKQVVAEEFDKLKGEIQPLAPQIVSASQAQAAAQGGLAPGPNPDPRDDPGSLRQPQQQYDQQPIAPVAEPVQQQNQQQQQQSGQSNSFGGPQPSYAQPAQPYPAQAAPAVDPMQPTYGSAPVQQGMPNQPQNSQSFAAQPPQQQPPAFQPQQPAYDQNQSFGPPANSQQPMNNTPYGPSQAPSNNGYDTSQQQPVQTDSQSSAPPSYGQQPQQPPMSTNPFGPAPQFGPSPSSGQPPTFGSSNPPSSSAPFGQQPPQNPPQFGQ